MKQKTVSRLALFIQLAIIFVGYPMQIAALVQNGSSESLSLSMFTLVLASHVLWGFHGWLNKDRYILIPQIPGSLFAAMILVIGIIYRFDLWIT